MQPAVFLDRDNTLIANDGDLGDPGAVRLLDGVPEGLRALRDAGYCLVVVTNQAGVARGRFSEADVDAVHQRIARLVDERGQTSHLIDRFYYCPYHPDAELDEYRREHPWRKPNPGMLLQAARDMGIDLAASWMIGDQSRDVSAGSTAGCRTVLINGNGRKKAATVPETTVVVSNFREGVEHILKHPTNGATSLETPAAKPPPPPAAPAARLAAPAAAPERSAPTTPPRTGDDDRLHRAIVELTEELRSDRLRGAEFTSLKMAAGFCQLLVVLLALLGLLQLGTTEVFFQWMTGALLAQIMTLTLIVLDQKS
ncbi:MAG: D-glycero-alpha-D-manno-heptose-1,7-bisphosphate 7-phosphatase [Planctomycetota bacterium]